MLPSGGGEYHDRGGPGTLLTGNDSELETTLHELAHRFEKRVTSGRFSQALIALESEFLARRAGPNARPQPIPEMPGINAFSAGFADPYTGRDYGGRYFEILSNGVEAVLLREFFWRVSTDRDFGHFVLGILAGI